MLLPEVPGIQFLILCPGFMHEGFGDVLADGVKVAAERIGKGADEYAIHIQGQEVPAHDPRAGLQSAYTYWLDATPARHTQGAEGPQSVGVMPEYDRRTGQTLLSM